MYMCFINATFQVVMARPSNNQPLPTDSNLQPKATGNSSKEATGASNKAQGATEGSNRELEATGVSSSRAVTEASLREATASPVVAMGASREDTGASRASQAATGNPVATEEVVEEEEDMIANPEVVMDQEVC